MTNVLEQHHVEQSRLEQLADCEWPLNSQQRLLWKAEVTLLLSIHLDALAINLCQPIEEARITFLSEHAAQIFDLCRLEAVAIQER